MNQLEDDYWLRLAQDGSENTSHLDSTPGKLQITQIDGVEPLDSQFGVWPVKTVPDRLLDPLFGSLDPLDDDRDPTAPASQQQTSTYAILDAAKIRNLPEQLETSGLRFRCLFKGDAFNELKDVAPWIVKLEEGNTFTQKLFTQVDSNADVWPAEAGIYFRADGTLEDLWRHFRRFTRVQDNNGKWYYQRFWEGRMAVGLLHSNTSPFVNIEPTRIRSAIFISGRSAQIADISAISSAPTPPILLKKDRDAYDMAVEQKFSIDFSHSLAQCVPEQLRILGLIDTLPISAMITGLIDDLRPLGFRRRSDIGRLAVLGLYYGRWFLADPRVAPFSQEILGQQHSSAGLRALRMEETLAQRQWHQLVTTQKGLESTIKDLRAFSNNPATSLSLEPEWDFQDQSTRASFLHTCHMQQVRHSLPDETYNDHRHVHTILARLWTPFFLDDPMHKPLKALFDSRSATIAIDIIDMLESRLPRSQRGTDHG